MTRLFGVDDEFGEDAILGKLEGMKDVIEQVNRQFKDPVSLSIHFTFSVDCIVDFGEDDYCTVTNMFWIRVKQQQVNN